MKTVYSKDSFSKYEQILEKLMREKVASCEVSNTGAQREEVISFPTENLVTGTVASMRGTQPAGGDFTGRELGK